MIEARHAGPGGRLDNSLQTPSRDAFGCGVMTRTEFIGARLGVVFRSCMTQAPVLTHFHLQL